MKRIVLIIIATLVICYAVAAIVASQVSQPEPVSITTQETFRTDYLQGCTLNPGLAEYCNCTYDRLVQLYGNEGLVQASSRLEAGNFSAEDKAIIYDCLDKIKQ